MFKKALFLAAFAVSFSTIKAQTAIPADINGLLQKHSCYTCHKAEKKMVGPSWSDIAAKKYTAKQFIALVYKPVPSNWSGYVAMAALPNVPKGDLTKIATWVSTLAK